MGQFSSDESSAAARQAPARATPLPWLGAVFALGVSCVMTQLALLREMLGVFAGNELVLGVVLGNWLLMMGLGAALGRSPAARRRSAPTLIGLLILTAVLAPAQVLALRALRQFAFLHGEAIGLLPTVVTSLLGQLPYCLAAGLFLALACRLLADRGTRQAAGRVYWADSLGSVGGGILFSFVLVLWLDHLTLLAAPAALSFAAAAWLLQTEWLKLPRLRALALAAGLAVSAGLVTAGLLFDLDAVSSGWQHPGHQILYRGNSAYSRLLVTTAAGQTNLVANGVVLSATPDIEQAEETVHFALAQRPGAKRVLLLGGALSGAPHDILRWGVAQVDCVELDPKVLELAREILPAQAREPRLQFIQADPRQFVRHTRTADYDVILVASPDPATAQLNRLFTREFFDETRRILRPGGVLSFAVGHYENYVSPELSRLLSCARHTVVQAYPNVRLIPASRVYFLASDGPLSTDIVPAIEQAEVKPQWLTRNWLAASLTPDRLADLDRASTQPAPLNLDFTPALYYLHLRHWASQFDRGPRWLVGLLAAGFLFYGARLRAADRVIFASGFAGAALEIVLLLSIQILAGSVYRQVGLVVAVFMLGLAVGAWLAAKTAEPPKQRAPRRQPLAGASHLRRWLALLAVLVGLLALVLPVSLHLLARWTAGYSSETVTQASVGLATFLLAGFIGAQFPLANALEPANPGTAARVYTADFVGAFLGALLTSLCLLPLLGVNAVCWGAAALNLAAALLILGSKKSP